MHKGQAARDCLVLSACVGVACPPPAATACLPPSTGTLAISCVGRRRTHVLPVLCMYNFAVFMRAPSQPGQRAVLGTREMGFPTPLAVRTGAVGTAPTGIRRGHANHTSHRHRHLPSSDCECWPEHQAASHAADTSPGAWFRTLAKGKVATLSCGIGVERFTGLR